MADAAAHWAFANRTQTTINHLCLDVRSHAPWIATCAFYKALHVVEALFASDPQIEHTSDHGRRFETLKRTAGYETILRPYMKLASAANIARYLGDSNRDVGAFEEVYSEGVLTTRLLLGNLHDLEVAATRRLGSARQLASIRQIIPILEAPDRAR